MLTLSSLGPIDNNAYILTSGKKALLIDAPPEGEKILQVLKLNKLELKYILITHGHTDHIASADFLKKETSAEIIVNEGEMKMFQKPWNLLVLRAKSFKPDILVSDGENIKIGTKKFVSLKVIHTPGHTQGSICFYEKKEKAVFTGDTLFYRTIGRTDFPGGNYKQLINSIKEKLFTLPENTKVYPGHGRPTIIKEEKEFLPKMFKNF